MQISTDTHNSFEIVAPTFKIEIAKTLNQLIKIHFNISENNKPKIKVVFNTFFQLLQNLGKVDRTADEIFDEHLANFHSQQNAANRLQKEFNNYIRCIRGNSKINFVIQFN